MIHTIEQVIGWLIVGASFCVWMLFLPQIKLLYEVKKAESLSLVTVYGSLGIQTLIFLQAILKFNYQLAFLQSMSMTSLVVVIVMVHYYRKVPGGR